MRHLQLDEIAATIALGAAEVLNLVFLRRDPPQVGWMLVHEHRVLAFDGWYAVGAGVRLAPLTECTDAEQPVEAMRARQWKQLATAIRSVPIIDAAPDLLDRLLERSQSPDWGESALHRRDHDTITGADVVAILPLGSRQSLRTIASLL